MFAVVFVGGERNGYVEESRFPLAQPFQEETETTALLCVFGNVAISLLLL